MNPLFVVGAPRSGTSYLARCLALADNAAYWEEGGAFALFGPRRFPFEYARILGKEQAFRFSPLAAWAGSLSDRLRKKDRLVDLLENMLLHSQLGDHDLEPSGRLIKVQNCALNADERADMARLGQRLRSGARTEGMEWVFQELFGAFLAKHRGTVLLEKTPEHILFIPVIRQVFPDARFLVIIRDKRECIASFLATFDPRRYVKRRFMSLKMATRSICREYLQYEQMEKWMVEHLEDVRILKYEEFIASPLEQTTQLCAWANLPFNGEKKRPLFRSRSLKPKWDRLTPEQQQIILKYFP